MWHLWFIYECSYKKNKGRYLPTLQMQFYRPRGQKTCNIEIAFFIDDIVWEYVRGVICDMEIIETAVNAILETDMFAEAEKAALKTIVECEALIEQYREDLKTTGLSKSARVVLLEDLSKQADLLEELQKELAAIQLGRAGYENVMQEYHKFVRWCQDFKKNGGGNATYQQKRDALRFLGIMVYIYKEDSSQGRYAIQVAPPALMSSPKLLPKNIDGTLCKKLPHLHR